MKFTCLQENLANKLSIVNKAVAQRASLSILSNILISAKGNRLKLAATNLQWSVVTYLGATVEEEGEITIPGNILTNFVSTVPEQKLKFVSEKEALKVETSQGSAKLKGAGSQDFPTVLEEAGDKKITIPSEEFTDALAGVTFAAATDESRPILTGVLFKTEGKLLNLVGVDGFRLSEASMTLNEAPPADMGVVIPARSLSELQRLASKEKEVSFSLIEDENQAVFEVGETVLASRLLDGTFPEYEQIIPDDFKVSGVVSLQELKKAIQLSSLFAETNSNVVRLEFDSNEDQIVISANTQEVGDNVTRVPAELEGGKEKIAFNAQYLTDILNYLDCENVEFSIKDPLSPGMIRRLGDDGEADESFLHIIMPVRVQEE